MKTKYISLLLFAAIVALTTACATVPLAQQELDIKAKNMTPPPNKALLYVYRNAIFVGSAVAMDIYIDGNSVGQLAEKTYLVVVLEPGKHKLSQYRDESIRATNYHPLNVKAGNKYYVRVSAAVPPKETLVLGGLEKTDFLAGYSLIHESEEPLQIVSGKIKDRDVPSSTSTSSLLAQASASDIDELPPIKTAQNRNAYAIIIGIEHYRQKLPRADFAVADANTVAAYLTKVLGYPEENVVTLLNDRALQSDLTKYFEKWLQNNAEKGSTVFIYYSGHGAPSIKSGDAFLVPYDGDPSFIEQTGYSLKRLYKNLSTLPAKEIIVALDSCFSGAGGRSVIAKGSRPLVMNLQTNVVLPKNTTVLSASSGDQTSSAYEEKGHGLFTYFMLKGIKTENIVAQDGSIKISDLFHYIKPNVERIARKHYNTEQTPQLISQ